MQFKKKQVVSLNGIEIFAYHGYYPQEQLIGTNFLVDVSVVFEPQDNTSDELGKTIDYVQINNIVQAEMKQTSKLLETVAERMINKIIQLYNTIYSVRVSIKKLHPPMASTINNSNIILEYTRDNHAV